MMDSENGAGATESRSTARPVLGLLEWFHVGDEQRVEEVLADAAALGITEIRTGLSWADYVTPDGPEWYDWLFPRLCAQVNVLPCFTYTPPSEGIAPKVSSPPREPKRFADFLDVAITRYGKHFEWVELWNEPNGLVDWDWRLDPEWRIFSEMIGGAAYWARKRGKKTVIGGMCPTDENWLELMGGRGVLDYIDVIGIHGFPSTWEFDWSDWSENIQRVQRVLERRNHPGSIWITEAGYSTWRHDEFVQLLHLHDVMQAPADRVYWYSVRDLKPSRAHQEGYRQDERHYHLGLKTADGIPKLAFRILEAEGPDGIKDLAQTARSTLPAIFTTPMAARRGFSRPSQTRTNSSGRNGSRRSCTLITGGAGFIGTNLADRLLEKGRHVMIFDNLSRPGVEQNLRWLRQKHGDRIRIEVADTRNRYVLQAAVDEADQVFHIAAQVAVTSSLADPATDFAVNVQGTLNLLEALRARSEPPPLVFTSTNKVYGPLASVELRKRGRRYEPADSDAARFGIAEECPLWFQSPYGCSKGAADQYVLDYAASFGLPATVFRMSCIYGPHQFGTEDQGWVAHFLLRAIQDEPITIYGDGCQVRDILVIDDLLDAFELAQRNIGSLSGEAFNIGGGPANTVGLLELIDLINELHSRRTRYMFGAQRTADQPYFVSDIRKFSRATGWRPSAGVREGIERLYQWLSPLRKEVPSQTPLKETRQSNPPSARTKTAPARRRRVSRPASL